LKPLSAYIHEKSVTLKKSVTLEKIQEKEEKEVIYDVRGKR
jgi:hypothetical protein